MNILGAMGRLRQVIPFSRARDRWRTLPVFGGVAVAVACAWAGRARAQLSTAPDTAGHDPYQSTLQFGTGLIDIPVAWVSPSSSDFWLSYGATRIPSTPVVSSSPLSYWNGNVALDTHWLRRFSLGASVYSNNPEWGLFGQVMLLREHDFWSWLPAVAVGFRNVGPYGHEDRYLVGHDVTVDSLGQTHGFTPPQYDNFHTSPTLYAVATKEILFPADAPFGLSSASLTVGGGNGLFSDDGGLGATYNDRGTVVKGLFFGGRVVSRPTANTVISILGENNGFDYNLGLTASWRGVGFGLYGQELEESWRRPATGNLVYNYKKISFALIYNGNFRDLAHGNILRAEISALIRQREQLRAEIRRRDRRIMDLQQQLEELQGSGLAADQKKRSTLEQQLQVERDAIKRAEDRLKVLEGGDASTSTPSSPSTSPSSPPASPPPASPPPATPPTGTSPK